MKLNVGIIGLGVGEAHITGYQSHPGCRVVALCDFDIRKYQEARKKYPAMTVTRDANEVLEDPKVDIVSVASYDNYHYSQVVKAIAHRKHVFAEKPLCLHEKEARQIRAILKKNPGIRISSNLILRQCPRFISLKKKIQKGDMGNLFHVEGNYNYGRLHKITEGWRGKVDFYSVIYGGGVHIVDLFLWLTGDKVLEVAAYGNRIASKNTQFRHNDSVTAILKFKSGMTGKLSVHFGCMHPHFHDLAVYGTRATFINGPECGFFYKSRNPNVKPKKMSEPYPGVHKGGLIYGFVQSVIDRTPLEVSKDDIFKTLSVCFAIEKAIRIGRPVTVNYI